MKLKERIISPASLLDSTTFAFISISSYHRHFSIPTQSRVSVLRDENGEGISVIVLEKIKGEGEGEREREEGGKERMSRLQK